MPLAVRLTGANRNDSQEALALVDAIPPLHGERGRPRQRPDCVLGDRGYDTSTIRRALRSRHIVPWLAMRRTSHGSGLGRWRWVMGRTFAWINQFRRLRVRYDKRADIHAAFLSLGARSFIGNRCERRGRRLSGARSLVCSRWVAVFLESDCLGIAALSGFQALGLRSRAYTGVTLGPRSWRPPRRLRNHRQHRRRWNG
jgi:transposase